MRVVVFSTKPYDREFLGAANAQASHEFVYLEARLTRGTATAARGADAVCVFVNDELDTSVLEELARYGVRLAVLRSAGFNNVDLQGAQRHGIRIARVPEYSPHAVAEHTVALVLALNRKIHRAYARTREGNFELDGLLGFDLHGRTVGVVGTGRIGTVFARIMTGFGCSVVANDPHRNSDCEALGVAYVELPDLLAEADIVSLHCPLTPETHHLIDSDSIGQMREGITLINTSRGAVVDTRAAINGLKTGKIGALGLDVYEEEAHLFFQDLSNVVIRDDVFARLLTFPNVLITAHQAFFTRDALAAIAETTVANLSAFEATGSAVHEVSTERLA